MHDIVYLPLGAAAFGGAERSLLELAGTMQARGRRVLILADRALQPTEFAAAAQSGGLEVEWMDWAPERGAWHNFRRAVAVFRQHPARLLHFNISWRRRMWAVPLAARIVSRAKLIGTMRAMPDPHDLIPRKRYCGILPGLRLWHVPERVVGQLWAKLLDVTVSINAKDFPIRLARDFGYEQSKIRVIYNGIHVRPAPPDEATRDHLRARLGAGRSEILFCYAGRLSQEKGIDDLLHALSRLPQEFKVVIAGEGPQRAQLEEIVRSENLMQRVRFLGFTATADEVMAAADAVIVPSRWYEAFGRVVVEAMNQGVPVVAARIGGMAELFDDGVEGLYFEPGQVDQLVDRLRAIGGDRERRLEMARAARRKVEADYSIARVSEQYAGLYAELLHGTRSGPIPDSARSA